jgi:hypothetical protein
MADRQQLRELINLINFVENYCMRHSYPVEFTLDDGMHVVVSKAGIHVFDFEIEPAKGDRRHFFIDEEEEFTDQKEAELDFDQLNALRTFWLITRNEA